MFGDDMKQKTKTQTLATSSDELLHIVTLLEAQVEKGLNPEITAPIQALGEAINKIAKSFSGSWLGYHAYVYYDGLKLPPPGAHFSQEWGLKELYSGMGTKGNWREYDPEEVKNTIYKAAGNPNLESLRELARKSEPIFKDSRSEVMSILSSELSHAHDEYLSSLKEEIQNLKFSGQSEILNRMAGSGSIISRDAIAVGQGKKAPAHKVIEAEITELHNSTALLIELADLTKKAASHLLRKQKPMIRIETTKLGFEELLHPIITEHCYKLYNDGHYRDSVLNSVIAIYDYIRERTKSSEDGDRLIGQVFSMDNPILVLSELETESGKNDQKGFMQIFKGAYQGIRNPKAHSLTHDLTPLKAAQYLIFASLLARRVEEANVIEFPSLS
jgi:uncharacterized protein (TIGR02391 family)